MTLVKENQIRSRCDGFTRGGFRGSHTNDSPDWAANEIQRERLGVSRYGYFTATQSAQFKTILTRTLPDFDKGINI